MSVRGCILLVAALLVGCVSQTLPEDMDVVDMTTATFGQAPTGFGASCSGSPECRQYAVDRAPGFLGCASYLGASYCTLPCGMSANGALCWQGSTCTCVERTNAGGFVETDCFCAKN